MTRVYDLAGQTFGDLTALSVVEGEKPLRWLCQCICGKTTTVITAKLKSGHTKSCGCRIPKEMGDRFRTHGGSKDREYRIWTDMLQRCFNEERDVYRLYGGRGITVCDRWRNDYAAFLADMGKSPFPKAEIDRIDNDGNYEPGNCRWVTHRENVLNRSNTTYIEYQGERLPLTVWAERLGVRSHLLSLRVHRGWTDEQVITGKRVGRGANIPVKRWITHAGETLPLDEWARRLGVSRKTLNTRYDRGWGHSEIVTGIRNKGE